VGLLVLVAMRCQDRRADRSFDSSLFTLALFFPQSKVCVKKRLSLTISILPLICTVTMMFSPKERKLIGARARIQPCTSFDSITVNRHSLKAVKQALAISSFVPEKVSPSRTRTAMHAPGTVNDMRSMLETTCAYGARCADGLPHRRWQAGQRAVNRSLTVKRLSRLAQPPTDCDARTYLAAPAPERPARGMSLTHAPQPARSCGPAVTPRADHRARRRPAPHSDTRRLELVDQTARGLLAICPRRQPAGTLAGPAAERQAERVRSRPRFRRRGRPVRAALKVVQKVCARRRETAGSRPWSWRLRW